MNKDERFLGCVVGAVKYDGTQINDVTSTRYYIFTQSDMAL
ncbi:hypothetical protein PT283_04465 [Acetobacteraceae bacterium ESL0697]|nr:hypothetical protein [Acetobacteraceae bacterium ESL0697]